MRADREAGHSTAADAAAAKLSALEIKQHSFAWRGVTLTCDEVLRERHLCAALSSRLSPRVVAAARR